MSLVDGTRMWFVRILFIMFEICHLHVQTCFWGLIHGILLTWYVTKKMSKTWGGEIDMIFRNHFGPNCGSKLLGRSPIFWPYTWKTEPWKCSLVRRLSKFCINTCWDALGGPNPSDPKFVFIRFPQQTKKSVATTEQPIWRVIRISHVDVTKCQQRTQAILKSQQRQLGAHAGTLPFLGMQLKMIFKWPKKSCFLYKQKMLVLSGHEPNIDFSPWYGTNYQGLRLPVWRPKPFDVSRCFKPNLWYLKQACFLAFFLGDW